MRIGIVSDVHCNADGLRLAIEHMGPIDELLCAGDIGYQYRFGNDVIEVEVGGKKLIMTHGSPIEPYDRYVYPGSKELAELADYAADYLILGHTHYQMAERLGRCLVINPGSAGEARDHRNGRLLSCCVLDTTSGEITFKDYEDPRVPTLPKP